MTFDLTTVLVSTVSGFFAVLSIVIPAIINARMKDQAAAATLAAAVRNSLGAMEQAAKGEIIAANPQVTIPGVPPSLAVPVQYVLTHAGDEAARFGITPIAIADKVNAAIGLQALAEKVAPVAIVPAASTVVAAPIAFTPDPIPGRVTSVTR